MYMSCRCVDAATRGPHPSHAHMLSCARADDHVTHECTMHAHTHACTHRHPIGHVCCLGFNLIVCGTGMHAMCAHVCVCCVCVLCVTHECAVCVQNVRENLSSAFFGHGNGYVMCVHVWCVLCGVWSVTQWCASRVWHASSIVLASLLWCAYPCASPRLVRVSVHGMT